LPNLAGQSGDKVHRNPVASSVAKLVAHDGFVAKHTAGDARRYALIRKGLAVPFCIMARIPVQFRSLNHADLTASTGSTGPEHGRELGKLPPFASVEVPDGDIYNLKGRNRKAGGISPKRLTQALLFNLGGNLRQVCSKLPVKRAISTNGEGGEEVFVESQRAARAGSHVPYR
jgi:hypothetical protein